MCCLVCFWEEQKSFKPTDKITGHWLGADDGKDDQIWLDENDKGVITGYVNDPKKSHIEGKRTGQKISIQILYSILFVCGRIILSLRFKDYSKH